MDWTKLFLPNRRANKFQHLPPPTLSHQGAGPAEEFDLISPAPVEKVTLLSKPLGSLLLSQLLQVLSIAQGP